MNFLQVNDNWKVRESDGFERRLDFPHDELIFRQRDYSAGGNENGYYRSEKLVARRSVDFPRAYKLWLEIEGARAVADVYVGADCVATVTNPAKCLIDVTKYAGTTQTVALSFLSFDRSASYTGLGLSGGIRLLWASDSLYIDPDGVFVTTEDDGSRALLSVYADITNDGDKARSFALSAQTLNARMRRVGKRMRKFKIRAHTTKRVTVPLKMMRRFEWSLSDAYLYTLTLALTSGELETDNACVSFGIRKCEITSEGFEFGNRPTALNGAVVSHDNGIIGCSSPLSAETRKARVLKDSGFNVVRFVGVPTENALVALDRAGLMCITDIFDGLEQPKAAGDGHLWFERDFERIIEASVKTLRKHPCVIGYGLGDCPPESYGRGKGAALGKKIAELIRSFDDTRFIVASAKETVPTREEMLRLGVRAERIHSAEKSEGGMLSLSREKSMFRDLTADWFAAGDVSGYAFLYPRYLNDVPLSENKVLGIASRPDKAFDAISECKRSGVLGEFVSPAIDSLGGGAAGDGYGGERLRSDADIDLTLARKSRSFYREICMGRKNKSAIVVIDPDVENDEGAPKASWYWPRHLGRPVTVKVYTGGDVVALYLDGKLVGRKLAGKINKYVATFRINYYPGKLEAVSFRKGSEFCRTSLESVSSPKALRLECDNKNIILSESNMKFVEIAVTDKEGRKVPRAQRSVEVTVTGEGELFALGNADPYLTLPASVKTIPVYEGRALMAVKATGEGKIVVKATGEGLLSAKITLKAKP